MALQVIGVGLGRTGTMSLKIALEALGFGPCYHMTECFSTPGAPELWTRAATGTPDWDAIFAGFAATVDHPGALFWRELTDFYPDAKVILSVRDPESWFESTRATIFSDRLRQLPVPPEIAEFAQRAVFDRFPDRLDDRDGMIEYFERHREEIERTIPPARLLVYEVAQGWDPLCRFLGVPVPRATFPRANPREDFAALFASMTEEAERGSEGEKGAG